MNSVVHWGQGRLDYVVKLCFKNYQNKSKTKQNNATGDSFYISTILITFKNWNRITSLFPFNFFFLDPSQYPPLSMPIPSTPKWIVIVTYTCKYMYMYEQIFKYDLLSPSFLLIRFQGSLLYIIINKLNKLERDHFSYFQNLLVAWGSLSQTGTSGNCVLSHYCVHWCFLCFNII